MKSKKGIFTTTLLTLFSLLIFSGCKGHRPREAFVLDYISEALDLTKEQEQAMESIKEEFLTEMETMQGDREQMYAELKTQLLGESIDKTLLRHLLMEHRKKTDTLVELAIERLSDFHADLTPQQRDKLVAKLEKFEKHHGRHFHR